MKTFGLKMRFSCRMFVCKPWVGSQGHKNKVKKKNKPNKTLIQYTSEAQHTGILGILVPRKLR